MELSSSYPRNLSYSIKELSNFSQQAFRVMTDRLSTQINAGEIFRVNLPAGSTLQDLRCNSLHFNFTATLTGGPAGCSIHAPRYSSSLIERVNIYLNNNLISTINQYNLLYNTMADLQFNRDAMQKRWLENIDPSANYTIDTFQTSGEFIRVQRNCANGTANDTNKPMVINNWLGFLGAETSTPVIDLASMGQITLEFQLAPASCCFISATQSGGTAPSGTPNYFINNVFFAGSKITFNSDEYYNLLASKLLNGGLIIGYKDYFSTRSPQYQKSSQPVFNYSINANSLDAIIATANISQYQNLGFLQLFGSQSSATTLNVDSGVRTAINNGSAFNFTLEEAISLQGAVFSSNYNLNQNPTGSGDLFNQTQYFQRNVLGLQTAQFFVNSIAVDLWGKAPDYIYEETLENLGLKNLDINCSSHTGCLSLGHFQKYYFAHVVRFNNISGDSQFYKSGMSANNSPINITYQTTFDNSTDSIFLVFFNCLTKVMSISSGRLITII